MRARTTSQQTQGRTHRQAKTHKQPDMDRREHRYVRPTQWENNPQSLSAESVRVVLGLPRSDRYSVEG